MDKKKRQYQKNMRRKKTSDQFYAITTLLILPLLCMKFKLGYLSVQAIVLLAITLQLLYVHSVLLWNNQIALLKPKQPIDWAVTGILILQLGRILFKLVDSNQVGAIQFEAELVIFLLAMQYWILSQGILYKESYLEGFLYVGLIMIAMNLLEIIAGIDLGIRSLSMFAEGGTRIPFFVLFCASAIIRFCSAEDKYKRISYGALSLLGVFTLFLEQSLLGIMTLGLVFPFLLLKGSNHVKVVKRVVLSAFFYFFLLSNMPLIIVGFGFEQMKEFYQLEHSIYLDLAIAIAGVIILKYWEKHYENQDESELFLPEVQMIARKLLFAGGILLIGILVIGIQGTGIEQQEEMNLLQVLLKRGTQELKQYPSAIVQAMVSQSWLGLLATLGFLACMLQHLCRKQFQTELWILSMIGMIQVFLLPLSTYVTPLYCLILYFALFGKKDNSKIRYQELRKQNENKIR